MSDNLEKFVSDNRQSFDDKFPPGKVWDHIDAALTGRKKRAPFNTIIKWSAAAAILIIGVIAYMNFNKKTDPEEAITQTEMGTQEVNAFTKLIVLKQEELKQLSKEQPELYNKFTKDITQLDSSYNALKNQLGITPNKEMLVEAMIQNLELQLSVLNQQLNIIKQIKQSKKYGHEKVFPAI